MYVVALHDKQLESDVNLDNAARSSVTCEWLILLAYVEDFSIQIGTLLLLFLRQLHKVGQFYYSHIVDGRLQLKESG